jgi:hypothetical protein
LGDIPESNRPDIYLDLSKGILLKNEKIFEPIEIDASQYFIVESAPLGLARFLTVLATITGAVQTRAVKWSNYIA